MIFASGCDGNPGEEEVVQTDQELLRKFIQIPKPADHVKFEIKARGTPSSFGPTEYKIYALLFYSDRDFEELTKSSVKGEAFSFNAPDWLREEYLSGEKLDEGELRLENVKRVDPESYFLSPYLHGEVIALDKRHALLVMFHTQ